jgi:hypothetical protein
MKHDGWVYTAYEGALTFEDTTLYITDEAYQELWKTHVETLEKLRVATATAQAATVEAEEYGRSVDQAQNERDAADTRARGWEREALRYAQNAGHWEEKYEALRKQWCGMISAEGLLRYAKRVFLTYKVSILSPHLKMMLINRARKVGYRLPPTTEQETLDAQG